MAEEGEVEIIDSGVQNAGPPKQNSMTETGALVEVAFQKDPYQKNKYLEAEPKALGITQIMLSLFLMSIRYAISGNESMAHLIFGGLSLFGLIAGGVAVGAQNLHLPTLKACLGVQVVMCVVSVFCMITNLGTEFESPGFRFCWRDSQNSTSGRILCGKLLDMYEHVIGVKLLAQAAQIALSATLAAFCCKVIQCCSPRTSVPVIAVNTARGPQ
ncbi:uncharacterized protein LOC113584716 isoform X1 [Electrophorus electricus]|uniref:uncharacterized protein LOC113584716 isoform X1 n=1 Tax=Electrophorus electricus TaxID=8005 RepID=UPI0015D03127|nr:uncharacterized protein LOC113584716 isoform X1 [Electrophorus electricus]